MNAVAVDSVVARPVNLRRAKALFLTLPLIPAADILFFNRPAGIGWTLWLAAFWGALAATRPLSAWKWRTKDLLLVVMMVASLAQGAWRPSFSNGLVLVCLTIYAAAHFELKGFGPWWERFFVGLRALGSGPVRWIQASASTVGFLDRTARQVTQPDTVGNLRNLFLIFAPAVLVGGFFLVLLGSGNAILGQAMTHAFQGLFDLIYLVEFPSFARLIFWAALGTAVLGLLWPLGTGIVRQSFLGRRLEAGVFRTPSNVDVTAWSTRMTLVSANLVFFVANTIDVVHLWTNLELPADVTLSQFVHQGTWNLIASVIIAALLLSLLYQQDPSVTRKRGIALLAVLWIGQNLLLLGNVGLRLKLYVDNFGLSVLRVHLALFLLLVAVGFVLLTLRIVRNRNLKWLFGANLLATILLFFVVQFRDTREFVARYNIQPERVTKLGLDLPFLVELGPSGWEALREVAMAKEESPLFRFSTAAFRELKLAAIDEKDREREYGWRSLQGARLVRASRLPGL